MKSDFFKDLSFSSATAGFVAVLVACTSSMAIVFQTEQAFGADYVAGLFERAALLAPEFTLVTAGPRGGGDVGIPVSKIITLTGMASFVLAPFGGYALDLAVVTAAICMGPKVHPEPWRRYTAAVVCGAIYIVVGCFGAAVTGVLTAFPKERVAAIAGVALLGTIGIALLAAMQDEKRREATLITFLVTLNGAVIAGVGSAFWGVVTGATALLVQHYSPRNAGRDVT